MTTSPTRATRTTGGTSASERLEASLAAIAEHGARTNAFILVDAEGARAAARTVDEERARGVDRGPLHGMPISIKDLIDVAGQPTTAGSRVRAGHIAHNDAPLVQRLRNAGAVLIGKTNLHEFALGTTSDVSAYGAVHNPHDTLRSAGGSSGGSAAAVAAGMGEASIGSDTGGSIRIPASACGVVGLKPSLGEVPLDGVVPLSVTFDHVGPITRTVTDAAQLWAVLAGVALPHLEPRLPASVRLGALGGYFTALLAADVRAAFDAALAELGAAGMSVERRTVEQAGAITDTYTNIQLPEASHWHAETLDTQGADYQTVTRERLESGRSIPAVKYLQALEMRRELTKAVDAALEGCDVLVLPTLPIVAPLLGATEAAMDASGNATLPVRSAMLRLTQLFNVTGHPAISIPVPASAGGLPVGMQLVGRRRGTAELLAVALACEAAFGGSEAVWHAARSRV
jgi:Asp-tRNA(Asn)/Glu-tRNA(Gln) amidotransferase A subunit family amidase